MAKPFPVTSRHANSIESLRVMYGIEPGLDAVEFRDLLIDSGLGAIRPVADLARIGRLIAGADLIVTARLDGPDGPLIGAARCLTDHAWCCFLSDLAVARSAQGLGVGKGLLDEVRRRLGPEVSVTLVSVPEAVEFYAKAGMRRLTDAFSYMRTR